jgi:hypothetical protein
VDEGSDHGFWGIASAGLQADLFLSQHNSGASPFPFALPSLHGRQDTFTSHKLAKCAIGDGIKATNQDPKDE